MAAISQFRFPVDMRFGPGGRSELGEFAEKYDVNRPLLVTDSGLVQTKAFALVVEAMDKVWPNGYERFTGVDPNPTDQNVDDAFAAYQKANCDGVVGLGGGSALDAARAMRLKVAFPDTALLDMPCDNLPAKLTPFCAIPTTAGTGSEVGRSSVITVPAMGRKAVIGAAPLMAELAILDPELTVGLPAKLTAWTGMDAMVHAMESLVTPIFHPMCDAIALEAMRIVWKYLPQAYDNGSDIEARGMMQMAAAMGATAFQKDLGVVHSMAHPLSTVCNVQHGLANAICLAPVMDFNKETCPDKYARVAQCFGINTFGMSELEASDAAIDAIEQLNKRLGIPKTLAEVGVKKEQLTTLAKKAFEDPCHQTNPRPCSEEDLLILYNKVYE